MKRDRAGRLVFLSGPKASWIRTGILVSALAGWMGCEGAVGTGKTLDEIREGQAKILERLDKIEANQQKVLASAKPGRQRPQIDYNTVYSIDIGKSAVRGGKDAKVTLVEFSDIQCPYSQRAQPLITQLLEAFPNDFQHVFKNFPLSFHKRAKPAAQACLAAGLQGKYWEMHALAFKNPKKLEDSDLTGYAKEIGLDVEKFEKDLKGNDVEAMIAKEIADARKAKVSGTPTLFLNGKRVKDRSLEGMKKTIEALRKGDAAQKGGK